LFIRPKSKVKCSPRSVYLIRSALEEQVFFVILGAAGEKGPRALLLVCGLSYYECAGECNKAVAVHGRGLRGLLFAKL
jgi:hypothetical protein